jgi:hypothetical protein
VSAEPLPPTRDQVIAALDAGEAFAEPEAVTIPAAPAIAPLPGKLNRNDVPPAVLAFDWLPPDQRWPELNELRETHVRLRAASSAAAHAVSALERNFAAEDEAKDIALKAAFTAGTDPELPEITPDADRESQLKEARTVARAASAASFDHIDKVLEVFGTRYGEFFADLNAEEHMLNEQIRQTRARLNELMARRSGTNQRTREWIDRIRQSVERGLPIFMMTQRWAETPVASLPETAEGRAAFTDAATRAATADGTLRRFAPAPPISAPDRDLKEYDEYELADLEHEDIVDWLMGAGTFDGEPKPTVADVIAAVEDNNPDLARRVLKADAEAYGGEPRRGVAAALNKIIDKESNHV